MKLYTEEMVKRAISLILYSPTHSNLVLDHLTPIELPSDEEIEIAMDSPKNDAYSFMEGAKWVIDKIKNTQQ